MTPRRNAKTHFVPKIIFKTTFAGVVPLCVAAAACGGKSSSGGGLVEGVACVGFNGAPCGVAAAGFTDAGDGGFAGVAALGFDGGVVDAGFTVACIGFNGGPCASVANAGFTDAGGDADALAPDAKAADDSSTGEPPDAHLFVVACIGFGGGPCGAPDAGGDGHVSIPTVAAIGFALESKG